MRDLLAAIPGCIDAIAGRYAAPPWEEELELARREFDQRRGRVFDDEELYIEHMAAFLEWFVLERPLPEGRPPVVVELARAGSVERPLLRALALSHRSLFELVDLPPGALRLLDLIGGGLWRVAREGPRDGLAPGEIFEGRLIPLESAVALGPVCCWHPRAAAECIRQLLSRAERRGRLDAKIVFDLAQMRVRHGRYRNIAVSRIYSTHGLKGDIVEAAGRCR